MPHELHYIALIFALFVLPKFLQRYRLPSAITSLALGFGAALLGWFNHDATVSLLATYGIVALFLFAGLDIDFTELKKGAQPLVVHLVIQILLMAGVAAALQFGLGMEWRPAALLSLALVSPSTGFILDSLHLFGLNDQQQFWVRSKAIAVELLALAALFVILKSKSAVNLSLAFLALAALIGFIPLMLRAFAVWISPFAPRSEVAFLLMLAVVCAYATRELGVYYLVGAFIVGMAARRFREHLPAESSERILHAMEAFASVFAPFYFFKAGTHLKASDFNLPALLLGAIFLAAVLPLRFILVLVKRRWMLKEKFREAWPVSVALTPTLVFSLVLAEILAAEYRLDHAVFGGLIIYTLVNTMLPGFLLKAAPPDYLAPHLDEVEPRRGPPASPPTTIVSAPGPDLTMLEPHRGPPSSPPTTIVSAPEPESKG